MAGEMALKPTVKDASRLLDDTKVTAVIEPLQPPGALGVAGHISSR